MAHRQARGNDPVFIDHAVPGQLKRLRTAGEQAGYLPGTPVVAGRCADRTIGGDGAGWYGLNESDRPVGERGHDRFMEQNI